jgi:hypothetical protein
MWKYTKKKKKLFLHPVDLSIMKNCIHLISCGSKLSDRHFRLMLVRGHKRRGKTAATTYNPTGNTNPFH